LFSKLVAVCKALRSNGKFLFNPTKFSFTDPSVRPVVIVDLLACLWPMYGGLDLICGGQGRVFEQRWRTLIAAFDSAGIDLVFVLDGPVPADKLSTWKQRRYSTAKNFVFPVFDALVSWNELKFSPGVRKLLDSDEKLFV
jgi:hypothetical protein